MYSGNVYVWDGDTYDRSRWLAISHRPQGSCALNLVDLCHPGQSSTLHSAQCDFEALDVAVDRGALQLTLPKGYLLLCREEDAVTIEFKGNGDPRPTRVRVKAHDVLDTLKVMKPQPLAGATP